MYKCDNEQLAVLVIAHNPLLSLSGLFDCVGTPVQGYFCR